MEVYQILFLSLSIIFFSVGLVLFAFACTEVVDYCNSFRSECSSSCMQGGPTAIATLVGTALTFYTLLPNILPSKWVEGAYEFISKVVPWHNILLEKIMEKLSNYSSEMVQRTNVDRPTAEP